MANVLGLRRRGVTYCRPGRAVTVTSARNDAEARALFLFRGALLGDLRGNQDRQRKMVHETFDDMGWETPKVLEGLDRATDLYFDTVSSVRLDRYSRGRVVLLGDAAYGGTLGGQGTPLAIVGAYVLAGELAT